MKICTNHVHVSIDNISDNQARKDIEEIKNDINGTDIKIYRARDTEVGTTYYVAKIPYTNSDGSRNIIKKEYSTNDDFTDLNYPANMALKQNALLACNASSCVWNENTNSYKITGIQIKDGVALADENLYVASSYYTLGVKEDGTLSVYPNTTTSQQLLDDGVVNSFAFTVPVIINGQIATEEMDAYANASTLHPRNVIGQDADKNIYILISEGRRPEEAGFTLEQVGNILIRDYNCIIAYNLDGGGSAQLLWDGIMINTPIDETLGTVERKTSDILYVVKEKIEPKQEEKMRKNLLLNRKFMDLINDIRNYGVKKCQTKGSLEINSLHETGRNLINLTAALWDEINVGIQTIIDNKVKSKLGLHPTMLKYTRYNDDNTSTVIFNVDDSGDIYTQKGIIGMVNKSSKIILDLNDIEESGFYWCNSTCTNIPTTNACSILAIGTKSATSGYMTVDATEWRTGKRWHRYYDGNNGGWSEWIEMS